MSTMLLFKSDSFDQGWPEDDRDPNEPPLGQDLAAFLHQKLVSYGLACGPVVSSCCDWEFEVTLNQVTYSISAGWMPVGDYPQEDYWVVRSHKRKGLLKALFGRAKDERDAPEPAIDILSRFLSGCPEVVGFQRLDEGLYFKL